MIHNSIYFTRLPPYNYSQMISNGESDDAPCMFDLSEVGDFHEKLEYELDVFLRGIDIAMEREDESYVYDNIRAMKEVRRRALKIAGEAYLNDNATDEDVDAISIEYTPGEDIAGVMRSLMQAIEHPGLFSTETTTVKNLLKTFNDYSDVTYICPAGIQRPRLQATIDTAVNASTLKVDERQSLPENDDLDHHQAIKRGCLLVSQAQQKRSDIEDIKSKSNAIQASVSDHKEVAEQALKDSHLFKRGAEALSEILADDPCGLEDEKQRREITVKQLESDIGELRRTAAETLQNIINQYSYFTDVTQRLCSTAKECRLEKCRSAAVSDAASHFSSLIHDEINVLMMQSEGAQSTSILSEKVSEFIDKMSNATQLHLKEHIKESEHRLESAQSILHTTAGKYFRLLESEESSQKRLIDLSRQRLQFVRTGKLDSELMADLERNGQQAQQAMNDITLEMHKVREVLDSHGVTYAMRARDSETFADTYDRGQRKDEATRYFTTVLTHLKEAEEIMAEIADTPSSHVEKEAPNKVIGILYSVLLSVADSQAALTHSQSLPPPELQTITAKLKRASRTAALNFSELNNTHPGVLKQKAAAAYALPDGGKASNSLSLAPVVFGSLEIVVRVISGIQTDGIEDGIKSLKLLPKKRSRKVVVSNASPKLRLSSNKKTISKITASKDIADSSAVCAEGYSRGTGCFSWDVKLLNRPDNLMIGVSDSSLSVTSYCNAIKHPNAYFLNVTSGTLWSASLHYQGHSYWPDILDDIGSVITVIIDTDNQTLSFCHNGRDLGVAFVGLNFSKRLHPAFEVTSAGCEFELQ